MHPKFDQASVPANLTKADLPATLPGRGVAALSPAGFAPRLNLRRNLRVAPVCPLFALVVVNATSLVIHALLRRPAGLYTLWLNTTGHLGRRGPRLDSERPRSCRSTSRV